MEPYGAIVNTIQQAQTETGPGASGHHRDMNHHNLSPTKKIQVHIKQKQTAGKNQCCITETRKATKQQKKQQKITRLDASSLLHPVFSKKRFNKKLLTLLAPPPETEKTKKIH